MNAAHVIQRRKFLRTTSIATGLMTILGRFGSRRTLGAEISRSGGHQYGEATERILAELEAKGGKFLNVPAKDGQFLNLLIKATRARSVLEVGTSHGHATIWIGQGLQETDGKLTTIEILSDRVELARKHVDQAGFSRRVTFKEGNAHEILPTIDGPFDFVFLNADKDGQMDYFKKLYPKKLQSGGIIAVHKAISRKDAMKEYLEMISQHADFDSVILSLTMDDGFSVSCRRRK